MYANDKYLFPWPLVMMNLFFYVYLPQMDKNNDQVTLPEKYWYFTRLGRMRIIL